MTMIVLSMKKYVVSIILCILGLILFITIKQDYRLHIFIPGEFIHEITRPTEKIILNNDTKLETKQINSKNRCSDIIPCTVWMLWDKGWDKAPPLQQMCLNSFKRNNKGWNIRAITLDEADTLINRSQFYSTTAWKSASIQAKSDIIRVELIARYGGVWADATVYCTEPLSNWIDTALKPTDFFVYERKDGSVNKGNKPWIASWFIAGTNKSQMANIWRESIRNAWGNATLPPQKYGYFWVHRIFRQLALTHTEFLRYFTNMTFMDAAGPHCWQNSLQEDQRNKTPHVYKAKAASCSRQRKTLFEMEKKFIKADN